MMISTDGHNDRASSQAWNTEDMSAKAKEEQVTIYLIWMFLTCTGGPETEDGAWFAVRFGWMDGRMDGGK